MKYKCEKAQRVGEDIRCNATDDICGNIMFCRMSGRIELTSAAINCPKRKGEQNESR